MDVSRIPLPVSVSLGEATLRPSSLKLGDILLLGPLDRPLEITIAGRSCLRGFPGTSKGYKAVEIVDE